MNSNKILKTPFVRQCFVTLGVTMNVMCYGMDSGYASVLFPQLRETKYIELDDELLSWVASIVGFSIILGSLIAPVIMCRKGRRIALISGCLFNITGWALFIAATDMATILIARFVHGLCLGIGGVVAHLTIGEYTSPKYRGAFMVLHPFSMFLGSSIQHVQGVFLSWKVVAAISLAVNLIAMYIVIISPETPSFLATKGKFDCCRKSFRWLRGNNDDDELEKMIKAAMLIETRTNSEHRNIVKHAQHKIYYAIAAIKKAEFYKPVILIMHLQFLNMWCGCLMNDTYTREIFIEIFGNFSDMYYVFWSLDIQKILTSGLSMIVIHKVRRKNVFLVTALLNIVVYISIAGYVYGKIIGIFPNYIAVGIFLLHMHYFTAASGCSLLPNIISGEIYPLEYRGVCGMISTLSFSTYLIIKFKTLPFLFSTIGLYGAYLIYACLVFYSLVIILILLPETKDKTLQDIENEFRGVKNKNDIEHKNDECNEEMIEFSGKEAEEIVYKNRSLNERMS